MGVSGVDHIAVIATTDEMEGFFKGLGFLVSNRINRDYDRIVIMQNGEITVEIFVDPRHPIRNSGLNEPTGVRHVAFSVDDFDDFVKNTSVDSKGIDWFGNRCAFIEGPDGLSVEIVEKRQCGDMRTNDSEKLTLMYITNEPEIALIAEKYGVNRVWVDLETLGKEERQKNMNTVKSKHCVNDIKTIKPLLKKSELLVRINPWNEGSVDEIEAVIAAGADMIMLPYWKTVGEVEKFLRTVDHRKKTTLLLETKEGVECIDEVLRLDFDEIHIGLNDLHLSYGMDFMFELLSNGTVECLCRKFKEKGVPYGFGGIAKLGDGLLPAEKIIMEHYRLGSTRAILSRTFCDNALIDSLEEIDRVFKLNMKLLREYEDTTMHLSKEDFAANRIDVIGSVEEIVKKVKEGKKS